MKTIMSPSADHSFIAQRDNTFDLTQSKSWANNAAADLNYLSSCCHCLAASKGWWHRKILNDAITGPTHYVLAERNVGELIALMHSELSEAFEAARKDIQSDHIPEFTGIEEELADTLVRIFDFAGAAQLRLGEAFVAKLKYNMTREDHKLEVREASGGKQM